MIYDSHQIRIIDIQSVQTRTSIPHKARQGIRVLFVQDLLDPLPPRPPLPWPFAPLPLPSLPPPPALMPPASITRTLPTGTQLITSSGFKPLSSSTSRGHIRSESLAL